MNWFHISEKVKNREQISIYENKDWTLLISTYMTDQFLRLTSKRFNSVYWYRPFEGQDKQELIENLTNAGFGGLLDD